MSNRFDQRPDTGVSRPPLPAPANARARAVHGVRIPHDQLPHGGSGSGGCSECALDTISWSLSVELMGDTQTDSLELFVETELDAEIGLDFKLTSEQVAMLNEVRKMTFALESQPRGKASRAWVRTEAAGVFTDTKINVL